MDYQTNNKVITNLITLDEIFTERMFVIPDYQRGYSWEEQQLLDLKKDVLKLNNIGHKHYTGTIVITKNISNDCYDIVDGQQRLTSLLILLSQIYWKNPNKYKYIKEKYLFKGEIGNETQVFRVGTEDNSFFKDLIFYNRENSPENLSQSRILESKRFCYEEWLKDQSLDLDNLFETLTKKLGFILFQPDNSNEIGIMFEVINNRGKALSQLEKIKNYFIYLSTIYQRETLRQEINQKWGKILFNLNKASVRTLDEENSFLRNCYLVFYDPNKTKSWYVYDELKKKYENCDTKEKIDFAISEIKNFVDFLLTASLHYAYLLNKDKFFESHFDSFRKNDLGEILIKLRCQPNNASIMPIYLALMSRLDSFNNISKVIELLILVEKLNFRLYILPKIAGRADAKQSEMFLEGYNFYHKNYVSIDTIQEELTPFSKKKIDGDSFERLKMILTDYINQFCSEKKFIEALTLDQDEYYDYYNWIGLRYFLASYEKYLQKEHHYYDIQHILKERTEVGKLHNDFLSKEHIWASKNRKEDFPEDFIEKMRLGNFVLVGLSKNIQLSNNDIEEKIEEIKLNSTGELRLYQIDELEEKFKNSLEYMSKTLGWKNKSKYYYQDLSTKLNDLRETDLIKFALENWKLPEEDFNKFVKVDSFEARKNNRIEKYILNE